MGWTFFLLSVSRTYRAASMAGPLPVPLLLAGMLNLAVMPGPLSAQQIVTDGTIGAIRRLDGPNYTIGDDLGRRVGGNLFHSFSQFNLVRGESATFTGPPSVANVISRVTGGTISSIDGLIRSQIPGANLFVINPAGMVFGLNAGLDVRGSFHASTADYLRFTDGTRFQATALSKGSSFTAALPEAFGFLGPGAAGRLQLSGATLIAPAGKDLSLVGGPVDLLAGAGAVTRSGGRVQVVSAAGPGETGHLVSTDDAATTVAAFGPVTLQEGSRVQSGGSGGVFVRGGAVDLDRSLIASVTVGEADSGGPVSVHADALTLSGSFIGSSAVNASGHAGSVTVTARDMTVNGGGTGEGVGIAGEGPFAGIASLSISNQLLPISRAGDAGDVSVTARQRLTIAAGATIESSALSSLDRVATPVGSAGAVTVKAPAIIVDGKGVSPSGIGSVVRGFSGDGGPVSVNTDELTLVSGGSISTQTFGSGMGGKMSVTVTGNANFAGTRSGLLASADRSFSRAGDISLSASNVNLDAGAQISANTSRSGSSGVAGAAGTVEIAARGGTVLVRGTDSEGNASRIEAVSKSAFSDAGNIHISADKLIIRDGGRVTTDADLVGGGNIRIEAGRLVYLNDGRITTSVTGLKSGAGNIEIDPDSVVLNRAAAIQANATGGPGGAIRIIAGQYLASPDSRVEALSGVGISGTVVVQSPESNVASSLTELSGKLFTPPGVRREGCSGPARVERQPSSLIAAGRGGLPQDDGGTQTGTYFAGRDMKSGGAPAAGNVTDQQRHAAGNGVRTHANSGPPTLRVTCRR